MGENKGEENKKKKGTGGGLDELLGNLGPLAAMAGGLAKDGGLDGIINNLAGPLAALAGGLAKDGNLGSALDEVKKNKENKGAKNKESEDGMTNEKEGKES